jgi:hypothetical protein
MIEYMFLRDGYYENTESIAKPFYNGAGFDKGVLGGMAKYLAFLGDKTSILEFFLCLNSCVVGRR